MPPGSFSDRIIVSHDKKPLHLDTWHLNMLLAEWGGGRQVLSRVFLIFLIIKNDCRYRRETLSSLTSMNLTLFFNYLQKKTLRNVWNKHFSDVMFTILGQRTENIPQHIECSDFIFKCKKTKGFVIKWSAKWCIRILIYFFLMKSIFWFFIN